MRRRERVESWPCPRNPQIWRRCARQIPPARSTCAGLALIRINGIHWRGRTSSSRARPWARRFAGDPIVLYRGSSGRVFALEDRCAHRQVPLHLGVVSGDDLKCHYHGWVYNCTGKCVNVPYLGPERLPTGVRGYPAREIDGLIFVFPGDPALAESRAPSSFGLIAAQGLQDPALEPRSCLSLHLHARKPVRHESSIHASQADGIDPSPLPGTQSWRELGGSRIQFQPHRGQILRR